jgi:hypothetical protein
MKRSVCLFFYFICSLFNDALSNSGYVVLNDWLIMNWRGCGRKRSWPDLRNCSSICSEGQEIQEESQDNWCLGQGAMRGPPECRAEV